LEFVDVAVENSPVGLQNLKSAIRIGQQTLKSLELVNGGAIIAILTFYGNVVKDGSRVPIDLQLLTWGLKAFSGGLVAAVLAAICAYLSQLGEATSEPDAPMQPEQAAMHKERAVALARKVRFASIIFGLVSCAAFGVGTWCSANSFQPRPPVGINPPSKICTYDAPTGLHCHP
jgi:hypothetical protein